MKKEMQNAFYTKVGKLLTEERKRRNITIRQLELLSGQQWNTITAIERGERFMAHQWLWLAPFLGLDLGKLNMVGGETRNEEAKETNGIENFI